ncbi:hypothetical protein AAFF_G00294460 [Aldrovandia affinis]|uniref:Uncharacterized protein n=1 Tax=Aldrovandia affinis TaxID=143900 RepID=A0AAD7RBM2_9TELE|nr:hypothetical protein AAFF_G00294460 [Aldrovandia affinis]
MILLAHLGDARALNSFSVSARLFGTASEAEVSMAAITAFSTAGLNWFCARRGEWLRPQARPQKVESSLDHSNGLRSHLLPQSFQPAAGQTPPPYINLASPRFPDQ